MPRINQVCVIAQHEKKSLNSLQTQKNNMKNTTATENQKINTKNFQKRA